MRISVTATVSTHFGGRLVVLWESIGLDVCQDSAKKAKPK